MFDVTSLKFNVNVWDLSGDDKSDDEGDDGDEGGGMTVNEAPEETHPKVAPRWPTRMFATECIRKIISVCENNRAHFDLALARELREESSDGINTPFFAFEKLFY